MPTYRAYGLLIDSVLAIPGAVAEPARQTAADITICIGDVQMPDGAVTSGPYQRFGDQLALHAPGVASYLCQPQASLVVQPEEGSCRDEVCELLVATALPMMLWARGGIVLHASGIVMPGCDFAVAIAGPSGIGKSALAEACLQRGAGFVGDDTLWLMLAEEGSVVRGLPAGYFRRGRDDARRQLIDVPPPQRVAQAPLGAIFFLDRGGPQSKTVLTKKAGSEALQLMLKSRHRPRIPAVLGREPSLLAEATLHCRRLPTYHMIAEDGDFAGVFEQIVSVF